MSKIPRNKKNIGANYNKKNKNKNKYKNTTKQNIIALDTLYSKHSINEFTVCKSARLVTHDGTITDIKYNKLVGNMRSSVLVFKSAELIPTQSTDIHDLVQIKADKKARDKKKYETDMAETKDRMDILHATDSKFIPDGTNPAETDEVHTHIMDMLKLNEETVEKVEPIATEIPDPESTISPSISDPDKTLIDISINAEPVPATLPKKIAGNKYHRHFITDLHSKHKLQQYSQFAYLEIKVDASFMVIETPGVFKIRVTPGLCSGANRSTVTHIDHDILIVGDLQMKSDVIKQIDPNYGAIDVLREQEKFMNQIKEKDDHQDQLDMPELVDISTNINSSADFPSHFEPGIIKPKSESSSDSDADQII